MWLATKYGFYSIIEKAPGEFHVRARIRQDLVNLLELAGWSMEIHEWRTADYRYRIILDRPGLAEAMGLLALSIDYPNFKEQISRLPDQREKLHSFHQVWTVLSRLQSRDPDDPGTPRGDA